MGDTHRRALLTLHSSHSLHCSDRPLLACLSLPARLRPLKAETVLSISAAPE